MWSNLYFSNGKYVQKTLNRMELSNKMKKDHWFFYTYNKTFKRRTPVEKASMSTVHHIEMTDIEKTKYIISMGLH